MPTLVTSNEDGWAAGQPTSPWEDARNHAGQRADSDNVYDSFGLASFYFAMRGSWVMHRAFFNFNTSGISVAPSAATLKIMGITNGGANVIAVRSAHDTVSLHSSDFHDGLADVAEAVDIALANSAGDGSGTFASISGLTYSAATSGWSTSGYNDMVLTEDARDDMASLDDFKVCVMEYDHDYLDVENTTGLLINGLRWYENGIDKWPYIDYTAGAAAAAENATFFGANF